MTQQLTTEWTIMMSYFYGPTLQLRGLNRFILAIARVYLKLDGIFCSCDPVSGAQQIKYKPSLLLLFSPAHPHPCFSTHTSFHRHLPGSAQLSWATDPYADHVCLCAAWRVTGSSQPLEREASDWFLIPSSDSYTALKHRWLLIFPGFCPRGCSVWHLCYTRATCFWVWGEFWWLWAVATSAGCLCCCQWNDQVTWLV